jgi:hypothetical protein
MPEQAHWSTTTIAGAVAGGGNFLGGTQSTIRGRFGPFALMELQNLTPMTRSRGA